MGPRALSGSFTTRARRANERAKHFLLVLWPFLNHYSWPILASREQTVVGVSQWYCYETGKGGSNVQPTRVLPAVSVLSLVGVEYGGWALLGFLTGRGQLGQFRERFFRAGHAHAGVFLVLSLVYLLHLDRTGYSEGVQ
jgi:hypothetical protein